MSETATFLLLVLLGLGVLAHPGSAQPPAMRRGPERAVQLVGQRREQIFPQLPPGVAQGQIRVEFRGPTLLVESTLDVSNIVLEYSDGSRQKFDQLSGRSGEIHGTGPHYGKEIVLAWVKSGANLSADGPGYGQRFAPPAQQPNPRRR